MNASFRPLSLVICVAATSWLVAGCGSSQPERADDAASSAPAASTAPPPSKSRQPDPSEERVERAAPPELRPVALGEFEPDDPVAASVTGSLTLEDDTIRGANGAEFVTERVAIVSGDDEYRQGERYADALAVGSEQPVELRRVLEETRPAPNPGEALCREADTGYIALASEPTEGGGGVIKLIGLRGESVPASGADDISLCAAARYRTSE